MQSSSLSCSHHGGRSFKFQEKACTTSTFPVRRAESRRLPVPCSTKSYTSPAFCCCCSSSSVRLALRPHFQSVPLPLTNKPTWTTSTSLIPHTGIIDVPNSRLPRLRCGISSNNCNTDRAWSFRDWVQFIAEAVSTAFPIWVALGCLLGLIKPSSYSWVKPKWTVLGITLTMLGMGMTLTLDDLRGALAMPKELLCGFVLQYSVSFLISFVFFFPSRMLLHECIPSPMWQCHRKWAGLRS